MSFTRSINRSIGAIDQSFHVLMLMNSTRLPRGFHTSNVQFRGSENFPESKSFGRAKVNRGFDSNSNCSLKNVELNELWLNVELTVNRG
jgi:hypothetical protein